MWRPAAVQNQNGESTATNFTVNAHKIHVIPVE